MSIPADELLHKVNGNYIVDRGYNMSGHFIWNHIIPVQYCTCYTMWYNDRLCHTVWNMVNH